MITGNKNDVQRKKKGTDVTRPKTVNRFNFIIFQNYDCTVEGKLIPREAYNRIMAVGE